jgi:hypothetical protein
LDISSDITINGAGAATTIVQAGPNKDAGIGRILQVFPGATVTIQGLNLRHGNANGSFSAAAGPADAFRRTIGVPRPPTCQQQLDQRLAPAINGPDKEAVAAARKAGRSLDLNQAVALARTADGAQP